MQTPAKTANALRSVNMFHTTFTLLNTPGLDGPALSVKMEEGPMIFVKKGVQWRTISDNKRTARTLEDLLDKALKALLRQSGGVQ